jgi:hypothetical protein
MSQSTLESRKIERLENANPLDVLRLPEGERELFAENFTSLSARLDLQRGASEVITKIKAECQTQNPKNIFFKLADGFGQKLKTIQASKSNNTIGADIYSAAFGNREHSERQLNCLDSFESNQKLITDLVRKDLEKVTDHEVLSRIQQILLEYKQNWINYTRKIDLEVKVGGLDPKDASKNITVDYYQTQVEQKNVVSKYASRAFLSAAAGLGFVTGGAGPFILGGARGLASGILEENKKTELEADKILRNKLQEAGIDLIAILGSDSDLADTEKTPKLRHLLQEIYLNPEAKIDANTYQALDNFVTGMVANYSHKFSGELDTAMIDLGMLLFQIKSSGKIETTSDSLAPENRERDNQINTFVSGLRQIENKVYDIDLDKRSGFYRVEAGQKNKEGRNSRILKNVGVSLLAVGGGWALRQVVNGTLDDQIAGLSRKFNGPNGYQTQIGKDEFLVSKHALGKIADLEAKGYQVSTIDGQSQTGELVALTKDGHNISFDAAQNAIQKASTDLPYSHSPQSIVYDGQSVNGVIEIQADQKIANGLYFKNSMGNEFSVYAGDSGQTFDIDGRSYSVFGERDGKLILVDTQNSGAELSKTLDALTSDQSIEKYRSQNWFEQAGSFVSNGTQRVGDFFSTTEHGSINTNNYFAPLGGGTRFNGGDFEKNMTTWVRKIPGHNISKSLSEINPNADFSKMGKAVSETFKSSIKINPGAFSYDGKIVTDFTQIKDFGQLRVIDSIQAGKITDAMANSMAHEIDKNFPGWVPGQPKGIDTFIRSHMGGTISKSGARDIWSSAVTAGIAGAIGGGITGATFGGIRSARNTRDGENVVLNTMRGITGGALVGGATGGLAMGAVGAGAAGFFGAGGAINGGIAATGGGTAETVRRIWSKPRGQSVRESLIGENREGREPARVLREGGRVATELENYITQHNDGTCPLTPANVIDALTSVNAAIDVVNRTSFSRPNIPVRNRLLARLNTILSDLQAIQTELASRTSEQQIQDLNHSFNTMYSAAQIASLQRSNDRAVLQNAVDDLRTRNEEVARVLALPENTNNPALLDLQTRIADLRDTLQTRLNSLPATPSAPSPSSETPATPESISDVDQAVLDYLVYDDQRVNDDCTPRTPLQILDSFPTPQKLESARKYAREIVRLSPQQKNLFTRLATNRQQNLIGELQSLGINNPSRYCTQPAMYNWHIAKELYYFNNRTSISNADYPVGDPFIDSNVHERILNVNLGWVIVQHALNENIITRAEIPKRSIQFQEIGTKIHEQGSLDYMANIIRTAINRPRSAPPVTPPVPSTPSTPAPEAPENTLEARFNDLNRNVDILRRTLPARESEILGDEIKRVRLIDTIRNLKQQTLELGAQNLHPDHLDLNELNNHWLIAQLVTFELEPIIRVMEASNPRPDQKVQMQNAISFYKNQINDYISILDGDQSQIDTLQILYNQHNRLSSVNDLLAII